MSEQIQISRTEYEAMKEELSLLKDTQFLQKMNRLLDLLFEEKYGLYLGNDTQDLTEASIQKNWSIAEKSAWDNV